MLYHVLYGVLYSQYTLLYYGILRVIRVLYLCYMAELQRIAMLHNENILYTIYYSYIGVVYSIEYIIYSVGIPVYILCHHNHTAVILNEVKDLERTA